MKIIDKIIKGGWFSFGASTSSGCLFLKIFLAPSQNFHPPEKRTNIMVIFDWQCLYHHYSHNRKGLLGQPGTPSKISNLLARVPNSQRLVSTFFPLSSYHILDDFHHLHSFRNWAWLLYFDSESYAQFNKNDEEYLGVSHKQANIITQKILSQSPSWTKRSCLPWILTLTGFASWGRFLSSYFFLFFSWA